MLILYLFLLDICALLYQFPFDIYDDSGGIFEVGGKHIGGRKERMEVIGSAWFYEGVATRLPLVPRCFS